MSPLLGLLPVCLLHRYWHFVKNNCSSPYFVLHCWCKWYISHVLQNSFTFFLLCPSGVWQFLSRFKCSKQEDAWFVFNSLLKTVKSTIWQKAFWLAPHRFLTSELDGRWYEVQDTMTDTMTDTAAPILSSVYPEFKVKLTLLLPFLLFIPHICFYSYIYFPLSLLLFFYHLTF